MIIRIKILLPFKGQDCEILHKFIYVRISLKKIDNRMCTYIVDIIFKYNITSKN